MIQAGVHVAVDLAFDCQGAGPPVVILHGLFGHHSLLPVDPARSAVQKWESLMASVDIILALFYANVVVLCPFLLLCWSSF